jgi:hypothetical protein
MSSESADAAGGNAELIFLPGLFTRPALLRAHSGSSCPHTKCWALSPDYLVQEAKSSGL